MIYKLVKRWVITERLTCDLVMFWIIKGLIESDDGFSLHSSLV